MRNILDTRNVATKTTSLLTDVEHNIYTAQAASLQAAKQLLCDKIDTAGLASWQIDWPAFEQQASASVFIAVRLITD